MTDVIVATLGSSGDVLPFITLGAALRRRGHRVTLVANPHFRSHAANNHLAFHGVGTEADHQRVMQDADLFDWRTYNAARLATHFGRTARPLYDAVTSLHEPGRTVLLAHECPWSGAWIAAERHNIPLAVAVLTPARFPSRYDPPYPGRPVPAVLRPICRTRPGLRALDIALNVRRRLRDLSTRILGRGGSLVPSPDPFLAESNRVRSEEGLALLPNYETAWRTVPAAILCMWPEWLAAPQRDWLPQARVAGFPSAPLVGGGADRSPVPAREAIVFTTGSVASRQEAFFAAAVEACRILQRHGVLVTPHRDQVPATLPPEVTYVPHADFDTLFATAAAVVHHGGIGTIALALRAGVPQVIRPMMGEQFDNASRVERLGVGRMTDSDNPSASELARSVSSVLRSKHVDQRCLYWRRRAQQESLETAIDAIESLARRGEPAVRRRELMENAAPRWRPSVTYSGSTDGSGAGPRGSLQSAGRSGWTGQNKPRR